jgi:hypothetical protein
MKRYTGWKLSMEKTTLKLEDNIKMGLSKQAVNE